jgi:two-component system, OmpR family, phosphate regulon sensor histidine kinase PhoR
MGARPQRLKDPARIASSKIAWQVSILFLIGGAAWVLGTDTLLYRFVHDEVLLARIETAKGWCFVGIGAVAMFVVTRLSVRKLARSESTTRAVVDSIADGVLLLDATGTIVMANPAAARMLGARRPGELVGLDGEAFARRYQVALPDGRLIQPSRFVSQRALKGESPAPYKAVLHAPRRTVTAMVTGAPVRPVPGGDIDLAVSVMHDVTALERIEQMRDEFVSSAAHVLRTPVGIIKAHVELLEQDGAEFRRASIGALKRQCERIVRITDNLVALARLHSNSLTLKNETIDVATVVDEAAAEMMDARTDHHLTTEVRAHPLVFADRDRLVLVLRNLIEVAYQRAQPNTDVALVLDRNHSHGRIVVDYQPLTGANGVTDAWSDAGFAGLGLERYVTAELVEAARGVVGSDTVGTHRQDWIQIPTIEVPNG